MMELRYETRLSDSRARAGSESPGWDEVGDVDEDGMAWPYGNRATSSKVAHVPSKGLLHKLPHTAHL